MARWKLVFIVAVLTLYSTALSNLIQLTKDNFENYVTRTELLVVDFCVPWYEPCKLLTPELKAAATILSSMNIFIADIDCVKYSDLCAMYNVESYPTIRIFRGLERTPSRYRGVQKSKAIASYMIKEVLPPISEIDAENLQELKELDTPILVAYLNTGEKGSYEIFIQVAESTGRKSFVFGTATDKSLFQVEMAKEPYIVLWNPSDEVPTVYKGDFEVREIVKFATETVASPLIPQFTLQKFAEYAQSGRPLFLIFATTQEERIDLSHTLKSLALKERWRMHFVTADAVKLGMLAEPFGLDGKTWPAIVVYNGATQENFVFDQRKEVTLSAIENFVDEFWKRSNEKIVVAGETRMRSDARDEL